MLGGVAMPGRTFVIAEVSANHVGKREVAEQTVRAAAEAGADAVKVQTYTPDTITLDVESELFRVTQGTVWDGRTLYDLYAEAYMPWEWQPELMRLAESLGLTFFSSPFDRSAVDFLEEMDVPLYKVASFEITDIPLIEYVASKGKPVLLSTGVATLADIELALHACDRAGCPEVVLLKCTSAYPAPVEDLNLRTIPNMRETFGRAVGLSDHTLGSSAAVASVALGAQVVEKHFTVDRSLGGPDAGFSMEPGEFAEMVAAIRMTEAALGRVDYSLGPRARASREHSRSLFVVRDVVAGSVLTEEDVRSVRPAFGLHPRHLPEVLGRRARRDLRRGEPLGWDMFQ